MPIVLWVLCEIAIAACDLAEVHRLGDRAEPAVRHSAHLGRVHHRAGRADRAVAAERGFRYIEALVVALIAAIGGCFAVEICLRQPDLGARRWRVHAHAARSLRNPRDALHRHRHPGRDGDAAQSLPALLHRADAHIRADAEGKREAIRFATIDSTVALMFALFINAAILILSAADVPRTRLHDVAEIQDAYQLLSPAARRDASPARSSPSRCWLPARTRRSPARWPARS